MSAELYFQVGVDGEAFRAAEYAVREVERPDQCGRVELSLAAYDCGITMRRYVVAHARMRRREATFGFSVDYERLATSGLDRYALAREIYDSVAQAARIAARAARIAARAVGAGDPLFRIGTRSQRRLRSCVPAKARFW